MQKAKQLKMLLACLCSLYSFPVFSQDSSLVLTFNFNDHTFHEQKGKVQTKPVGVSLVEDRFGNERSAMYVHGHATSYFSLGTSPLLKPEKMTISLWVNLNRRVYSGRGYDGNPIVITKNGPGEDFICAYNICLDNYNRRFTATETLDSTQEVVISSRDEVQFNKWYHLVLASDDQYMTFYVNGESQGTFEKGFRTKFLAADSVLIGHSGSKKNERFSQGTFDDIQIFHRVLSEKEIQDLYHAPNPDRFRLLIAELLKWLGIAASGFGLAFILVWQRRKALKREKEKFELNNRLYKMEIRTLKSQMNPHFIFNSLNSIQQFIMSRDNENAEIYLSKFSRLLRKLLESNANEHLSVKEEVEILNHYLEIEALRFNRSFNYLIEIGEKIDQERMMIPHLMIQPFVENAIWHGLLPKKGEKHLLIRFSYLSEDLISCVIEDNGIGREASKLKTETFKKKSLALSLVTQRLQLMNNKLNIHCRIELIDKTDKDGASLGTKVIIDLPIVKK